MPRKTTHGLGENREPGVNMTIVEVEQSYKLPVHEHNSARKGDGQRSTLKNEARATVQLRNWKLY